MSELPKIHLVLRGAAMACGIHARRRTVGGSYDVRLVTCASCMRTKAGRRALRLAERETEAARQSAEPPRQPPAGPILWPDPALVDDDGVPILTWTAEREAVSPDGWRVGYTLGHFSGLLFAEALDPDGRRHYAAPVAIKPIPERRRAAIAYCEIRDALAAEAREAPPADALPLTPHAISPGGPPCTTAASPPPI